MDKSGEKCKSAALRYVAAAIKTEGQVRDYLARKGFAAEEIDEAISMLREYDYVNDARYCRDYYMLACSKGRGRRRIEQELAQKKISRQLIRESLDELLSADNPDYEELVAQTLTEKERAMELGRKLLRERRLDGKPVDRAFCGRVARRLSAMGYGCDIIYSVIGMVLEEGGKRDEGE